MTAYVAVDLGAQSGRVEVGTFTDTGLRTVEVHRFRNAPMTVDGELCWNGEQLFDEGLTGIARAVEWARERGLDVASVGVDSWGVDYGLINAAGGLSAPTRHYRAMSDHEMDEALHLVPDIYARTGIAVSPINTAFQLHRDLRRGLLQQGTTALLTPDLWTFWLTGERGAERTIASTTALLDPDSGTWDGELLAGLGLPADLLPDVVATGTSAGRTSAPISARIGATIPVVRTAGHDTASAYAAVADPRHPAVVVSLGTWALAGCLADVPVRTPKARDAGFTNEASAQGTTRLMRNLSGTWLLEECLRAWAAEDGLDDVTGLRDDLLRAAGTDVTDVVIDTGDPRLVPPGDMPARLRLLVAEQGGATGLDRVGLVRLVLSSVAASIATVTGQVADLTGVQPASVRIIGGGARIGAIATLVESLTALPVVRGPVEASSVGNILVQAVSAGQFGTLDDARAAARIDEGNHL